MHKVKAAHRSCRIHGDRKSTRLNSSHSQISYAVFCLKKKKNYPHSRPIHPPVQPDVPVHTRSTNRSPASLLPLSSTPVTLLLLPSLCASLGVNSEYPT